MNRSVYSSPARLGILALTLLALGFGGTTELWAQATVALLAAVLLFIAPPRRSIGLWPNILLGALFLLALTAFLPAWPPVPAWRHHLLDLNVSGQMPLPGTRTPQPWLTAQACGLLFVGGVWTYYVLSQTWDKERRGQAARILVCGVALLAGLALAAFALGFRVPGWHQEENRGWFPNRNQTSDVLALCGVLNYALISDCLRKKELAGYFWIFTLLLIGGALVVSYSRAGILMFFGGIVLWNSLSIRPPDKRRRSGRWLALSLSVLFVLFTLFFLFGGHTLERFEGAPSASAGDAHYRVAIQEDAFHFSLQSPWLGVGLGNFEPLFAPFREASVNANRAVHPESDWLWAACEMGWFAPIIFIAGIVWWLRRCLPFQVRSGESLRRAFTVAGMLFILHGFVDVSAHRFGSYAVGILVISMAIPDWKARPKTSRAPRIFRGFAVAILLIGGWWAASAGDLAVPPTTAKLARLKGLLGYAIAKNQLTAATSIDDAALRISPVDWDLYFQRGYAETFQPAQLARAGADFMIARGLESKWAKPCFDEGATWLAAGQPDLCLDAWGEALRRATPLELPNLYKEMVVLARSNEMVHADLLDLAAGNITYQLVFIGYATPDETKKIVGDVLMADPDLKSIGTLQRHDFFQAWWNQGDRDALMAALAGHPDWMEAGWSFLAQSYAAQKQFQQAWGLVARHSEKPLTPTIPSNLSLQELKNAFYEQDENPAAGIMLALSEKAQGQPDEAIATLRALEKLKKCPRYVYYLEAQLWAAKEQWELAWDAWWSYQQT